MNPEEAVALCRIIKATFPSQYMDEYTPDAWGMALDDIPFDIARMAVAEVARRHRFMSVSELRQAVSRMRQIARVSIEPITGGVNPVHDGDPDNVQAWLKHMRAEQARLTELADEAIRQRALNFAGVDLAADPEGSSPSVDAVPVDVGRLQSAIASR